MGFHLEIFALALAFSTQVNAGSDRTSEADEAAIKGMISIVPHVLAGIKSILPSVDPSEECAYYTYQPVEDARSKFPDLYKPAYIVDGDDAANALFDQISPSIPDIQPKVCPSLPPDNL